IISLKREINPILGVVREALQAKKDEALKSTKAESSDANRSKTPTKRFLQKYQQTGKQNLVIGLPLLVYLKDKPCSSCEKGKHHRAIFKIKQTSSIKKCLHLLHMDLSRPVTPRSINCEKYTLVIVDEYSRADNGTKFWNRILVNFCDEKGISQNFSSPYTPEQNGVAERKNRTLIEAARTMLLVYIQTHKDHLGKFDEKADNGYLLGYSLVSRHLESSILEGNKLKKPITSHLMKSLMLLNSQDLQLTTSTLLKMKDIYLMNIFILMSLLKSIKQTTMMCPS
nr:hypothetical protein [Tanacetum cinerariifolium]